MAVDFRFTEAQVRRRMEFRKFALEEIAPPAFKTDLWHRFPPRENIVKMAERGYMGLPIPEEWGGRGADF